VILHMTASIIEMAFGRLVNKFWILSGKVGGSIDRVLAILTCWPPKFCHPEDRAFHAEYLYSTIEEEMDALCVTPNRDAPLGISFFSVNPNEEFETLLGVSCTREVIVKHIRKPDIRRPLHNIAHQRSEQLEAMVVSPDCTKIAHEFVSPLYNCITKLH